MSESPTGGRHPLEVLAEEFARRARRGERPTIDEYAAAHPDLAADIRDLFPTLLELEAARVTETLAANGSAPPRDPVAAPPPERLGDFRLVREIGRGGMGIVYEAVQESLGRRVAVKVLPRHALLDTRWLERFRREAQTAAGLHHTSIVPVFGTGVHDGLHYFVMQYIDGVGLDRVLAAWRHEATAATEGSPEGERAARIAATFAAERAAANGAAWWQRLALLGAQVANALHHAHQQGTLHRDVKPANLLVDEQGFAWVADFGLAKALQADGSDALTRAEDLLGTLQYMAPEQLHGAFDRRTDVFALGLTLYELATLRPAFAGGNRDDLLPQIAAARVERPSRIAPDLPRDLETVLLKALAAEPAHRYADAAELAADLDRFAAGRPVRARPASMLRQAWLWARRNRIAATLAASTAVAVLAGAAVGWIGYAREQARGEEARRATTRAENNLALALQAFEDVFDQVVGPDRTQAFVQDAETGEYTVAASPPVSPRDAALLQQVLEFYARFLRENAGNEALQRENARAHRRVGDIHQRLGQRDEARAAYRDALRLTEALPASPDRTLALASLHNELGRVLAAGMQPARAIAEHEAALALLQDDGNGSGAEPRVRLERARTHDLIAAANVVVARPLPPPRERARDRPTPPRAAQQALAAEQHARLALQDVDALLAADARNPECRLEQARALRWLALSLWNRSESGEAPFRQAIDVLRELVAEHPAADLYAGELVDTFALLDRRLPASTLRTLRAEMQAGYEVARRLVAAHPTVPAYRASQARLASALGRTLLAEERTAPELLPEATQVLRDAVRLHQEQVQAVPASELHFVQLLDAQLNLARGLRRQQRRTEAREVLEAAVAAFTAHEGSARRQQLANRLWEELAQEREATGDLEGAREARQQTERRR